MAAKKPMIVEELGVNRNVDMNMPDVLCEYQDYILAAPAIQGSMPWTNLNIDCACPNKGDPYAVCASDEAYLKMVTQFVPKMQVKAGGPSRSYSFGSKETSYSRIVRREMIFRRSGSVLIFVGRFEREKMCRGSI